MFSNVVDLFRYLHEEMGFEVDVSVNNSNQHFSFLCKICGKTILSFVAEQTMKGIKIVEVKDGLSWVRELGI